MGEGIGGWESRDRNSSAGRAIDAIAHHPSHGLDKTASAILGSRHRGALGGLVVGFSLRLRMGGDVSKWEMSAGAECRVE